MSVSNVNSIYGTQMGSNAGYDTPAIKIEEKESNIGAWLCGGLTLVATLGVGIAAHKSGKAIASNDDNMFQTIWKGIKSWVGKNGDDVATKIDDIPAECKTSFKTLFSGGEITATQKQDIVDNANEISKVFTNKARKNATKADALAEIAKTEKDEDKLKALAKFLGVKGDLTLDLDGGTLKTVSTEDQAIIARKLKNTDGSTIEGSIDNIISSLQGKYSTKQSNYNLASNNIKNLNVDTLIESITSKESTELTDGVKSVITKRLNRSGAAQTLAENCKDSSSYINTQNSLTKWRDAGDLTQDEYDNLRALAENKFMSQNGADYLKYMTQGLKKANGSEINFNSLDEESIKLLNDEFKGLNLQKNASGKTSLNAQQLIDWKLNNTKSISEYLGLNGYSVSDASCFKLVDGKLVWEASAGSSVPTEIFGKKIGSNCESTTKGATVTRMTLTMDNIQKIFKSAAVQS